MSDVGLLVIWPNHLHNFDKIIEELSNKFKILECYDIEWNKKNLFHNFYRFYGDRLATSSIKEKTISGSVLRLIIFEDSEPKYEFRTTARGIEKVNSNFFDMKKKFRKKFNTRFGIHGSNDEAETNRDLCLLLGINLKDYKAQNINNWNGDIIYEKRDIAGINGWNSFEEFFYFINAVEPYVILRNEDTIFNLPEGEDIDFLVHDPAKFAYFTNAKKLSKGTQRVNYEIVVKNKKIRVDFRYIGDGYFDSYWQRDCMQKRRLSKNNIYVMDDENAYYTLAYHAFIHKREFPKKYLEYFNMSLDELKNKLYEFMYQNGYKMVEPRDVTLNFNKKYGGDIKFSRDRRIRNKKGFVGGIKKIFYKLNHLIHFRRGPA